MKLLIEPIKKDNLYENSIDGLILSLKDFAVQSEIYFTIEEIESIIKQNPSLEIFININKNIFNDEIEPLKILLRKLDKLNVKGILFYDLAILKLKQELSLKVDLVWAQTHMVNNYKTCNYYYSKNVKYALLGKEITLDEIKEIRNKSKILPMVEVVGIPTVAFSRRKLITNYYKDLQKEPKTRLNIVEKITNTQYKLTEDEHGTNFYQNNLVNATSIIKDLYEVNIPYIIMKEYKIPSSIFKELVLDTKKYIEGNCQDQDYVQKYQKLGDNTNFFFKKTIYKVKKNEKN